MGQLSVQDAAHVFLAVRVAADFGARVVSALLFALVGDRLACCDLLSAARHSGLLLVHLCVHRLLLQGVGTLRAARSWIVNKRQQAKRRAKASQPKPTHKGAISALPTPNKLGQHEEGVKLQANRIRSLFVCALICLILCV